MTDPQNPTPDVPPAPAYGQPAGAPQSGYPQSGYPQPGYPQPGYPQPGSPEQPYAAAPPAPYGPPATESIPGRTLGIVAFVLSFFVQLVALILGIVALVQSRKAGQKNGFALAAIIISAVLMVIGVIIAIIVIAVIIPPALELARFCTDMGPGVHEFNGVMVNCSQVNP